MPWNDAAATDITIPTDGQAPDPFIYIGPDDPAAIAAGVDASIVFHFGDTGAYVLGVTQEADPFQNTGHINLLATDSAPGGKDFRLLFADYTGALSSCTFYVGEQSQGLDTTVAGENLSLLFSEGDGQDFTVNGRSQPRGRIGQAGRTTNSAAVGNVETTMLTALDLGGAAPDYKGGRAYRATYTGSHDVSVAANDSTFRVRKTSSAGQLLGFSRVSARAVTTSYDAGFECVFTTTNNLFGVSIVLTLQGSAAHNSRVAAAAGASAIFTVEDIGEQADWPDAPILV